MSVVWVIDWWERGYTGSDYRDAEAFVTKRQAVHALKNGADPGWSGRLYRVEWGGEFSSVRCISSVHRPALLEADTTEAG